MGFADTIRQGDSAAIVLNCATCGQPAQADHKCAGKRYLRNPKVVMVHPFEGQSDTFVIRNMEGDCSYVVSREVLKREYEEI